MPADDAPLAYNQQASIAEAIAGALAQTYSPLEILVSDDASGDDTWARMQAAVAGYRGPHVVRLNRNERNLGIGAHLSRLASLARGELLFVAAGDDVSLPRRCELVVQAWLAHGRRPDLIAGRLVDIDASGRVHGEIVPSALQEWRSLADWAARPPFVVGAAQAWTRRLHEHFGPLPEGTVAEDLVRYRRGGVSRRVRSLHAADVVRRLLKNNRHALVETGQMLRDAERMGRLDEVGAFLGATLERERFIAALFAATTFTQRLRIAATSRGAGIGLRLRLFVYAAMPWLLAPFFAFKRALAKDG